MTRIQWHSPSKEQAPDGVLCRWIVQDLMEGLIEIEAASNYGMPAGEWTEQHVRAWRVVEEAVQ